MEVKERLRGYYEGEQVIEYTLVNDNDMSVSCLNYGCVITKLLVPGRNGVIENVVLGFDKFEAYPKWSPYFGAVVGRVAGRIGKAEFELDSKTYHLTANDSSNHLHGGEKGFSFVIWETEKIEEAESVGVKFFYKSPDGEEGYPGNLETTVKYLLTNENELSITYEAKTDQKTLVNFTNHSYFNLSGNLKRDCSEHVLKFDSDRFLELDSDMLPTGKMIESKGTPFDFRNGKKIRQGIYSSNPQNVMVGNGYDHPLLFTNPGENMIELRDEESGRSLVVTTDQPCVVLYSANQLEEEPYTLSGNLPTKNYLGVCLEVQGYPDAIHHPEFPSIVLNPEETFKSTTKYRFLSQ